MLQHPLVQIKDKSARKINFKQFEAGLALIVCFLRFPRGAVGKVVASLSECCRAGPVPGYNTRDSFASYVTSLKADTCS